MSGLPQKTMAYILQISQSTYSRLENKENKLSEEQFEKILEALSLGLGVQDSLRLKDKVMLLYDNFKWNTKESNLSSVDINLYLTIIDELKRENRELKKLNEEYLERIHKLIGLIEIKLLQKL